MPPYLTAYSESHVDVFNVMSSEWIQTLNLRKVGVALYFVDHMQYLFFFVQGKTDAREWRSHLLYC